MENISTDFALIAFDLDGTLAESKSAIDGEMAQLLSSLLRVKKVAIISGAAFPQFQKQVIDELHEKNALFDNLYILAASGATLYEYKESKWNTVYDVRLTDEEKTKIYDALEKMFVEVGFKKPDHIYGVLIEDRGSQITFSAYGSEAPLDLKKTWDPDQKKRIHMREILLRYLPDFAINIGGTTSIDITRHIDKADGLSRLLEHIHLLSSDMLYVGDALFPGGNDSAVLRLNVKTVSVQSVEDTEQLIEGLLEGTY